MKVIALVLAAASSAMLIMFGAYAFAPWPGNFLGGAEILAVPLWLLCLLLGGGLAADTIVRIRHLRRSIEAPARLSR